MQGAGVEESVPDIHAFFLPRNPTLQDVPYIHVHSGVCRPEAPDDTALEILKGNNRKKQRRGDTCRDERQRDHEDGERVKRGRRPLLLEAIFTME
ncbi:unnamed protein product [Caretta caretta]